MSEAKVWTADELAAMSPSERDEVIRAGIITDPERIPDAITERARQKAARHLTEGQESHSTQ